MNTADDHALMLAVRGGENGGLSILFRRHHVALFNFFRKLGHTRSDSEDLVQDTFLRMLRYASGYAQDGNFGAWMYRIARNVAMDRLHDRGLPAVDVSELELAAAEQHEPAARFAVAENEALLQQALLRLPRDKRELVLLSRVRLLSMDDLAALHECSVGAVKVRLHRSLALLRKHFDQLKEGKHERA